MANTIRIKRRASGNAGAPSSLENAELAFNEVDDTLYYGKGTSGAGGTATTIEAIGGKGAVVMLAGDQTVGGEKTFSSPVTVPTPSANGHAATKGYVDGLTPSIAGGSGITATPSAGSVTIAADATIARLASPALTGTPTAPTAATATNTTQVATTAFVKAQNYRTGNQSITVSGDATGSGTTAISLTLSNSGATAGTYSKVTVDAKGRVTAGAPLLAADIPTLNQNTTGSSGSTTGNAATATRLATGRTISVTGDATGTSATFNGSANASIPLTLANSGVTAGTYAKTTVDAKGRVTAGTALVVGDIPTLTAAKISDFATQVRANRLDQMAAPTASVSLNSQKITGLAEPSVASDAATKGYVDSAIQGLDPKGSVRAATTANIATLTGPMTIDGVALVAGDRILVKDQTTASANGIYVVQTGAWTRAEDANAWDELVSAFTFVESGSVNGDCGFLFTVDPGGTLGTTPATVVQFAGAADIAAGNGLVKTGNSLAVGAGTGIAVGATTVGLTGQALALHNLASNGFFVRTAAGTVAARSIAVSGNGVSVANGNGVSGNPTLSLSAALSSVGGLTPAADRIAYYTSASAASLATLTTFGRSLIDDANASAARTTLGLNTMATQAANAVAITGGSIDGVTFDGGTF